MIKKFFKFLFSMMPDLTGFKELGFEVKTSNGDLYVERKAERFTIRFSQGFEPFNPKLSQLIDFEIPDGFIMVEFHTPISEENKVLLNEIGQNFQYHQLRGQYFFLYNAQLDFGTPGMDIKMAKIINSLDKFFR